MKLLLESLVDIWPSKMFNINHPHSLEYVTGVGLIDFRPFRTGSRTKILGRTVDSLTDKMEKIRHIYTLLLLGFCLYLLLNTRPTHIKKKLLYSKVSPQYDIWKKGKYKRNYVLFDIRRMFTIYFPKL